MKRPRTTLQRSGFTLVELLVAMTIFIVLTTLTIGAFSVNNSDRVSNSTATFRNALEGARSRAIKSGQVRGLRLIRDPNDDRMVTSLVYVGAPEFEEGILGEGTGVVITIPGSNSRITAVRFDESDWQVDSTRWQTLEDRGLLREGARIEIPANSGRWHTIVNQVSAATWEIAGQFQPSQRRGANLVPMPLNPAQSGQSLPQPYRLELAPTILAGSEPILLQAQTCIDLDGSLIPWRDVSGNYPTGNMDILFAPNGTIKGDLNAIAHFRVAHIADIMESRGRAPNYPPTNDNPVVIADPARGHRAVSIFAQTGAVITSEIDPTVGAGTETPNGMIASQPFSFAIRGRESR